MKQIRCAPHIHSKDSTTKIMISVIVALLPALFGSLYFFGLGVLKVVGVCIISCLLSEILSKKMFGKELRINDGSAMLTGLLLAFTLPPNIPLWIAAFGSFVAIFLTKELFGGIGFNIFNPALTARALLLTSFPVQMTRYVQPFSHLTDATTTATPLAILKEGLNTPLPDSLSMFIGNHAGCIGETSVILLLIGAIFLLSRKIITLHIPLSYILTVGILSYISGQNPVFQIMAGGLILGAFFMATDYVTSPLTNKGKLIFGIGCGIITFLIRQKGGYPEGVAYSILFMNMFVPLIDKFTLPKKFGHIKKVKL
ncbi:RnfABCDGE type electron transport complex subunit D [bacterium]|nr:RnfABCDGE type electron transport complex subunit D [bacterium]